MPTPDEVVAALEAKNQVTLTRTERAILARSRERVARERAAADARGGRGGNVPETLDEMIAMGADSLARIAADSADPKCVEAVKALRVLRDREIEQEGPVDHTITFKGGVDALDAGGVRQMDDAVLAERVAELRELLAECESEQKRRRA